ncbi:MAG TPA: outer membrane beta-barrel protein [Cyclobacteriaceae bacterium]
MLLTQPLYNSSFPILTASGFIFFFLFIFQSLPGFGQLSMGFMAGVNYANMRVIVASGNDVDTTPAFGPAFGIFLQDSVVNNVNLELQVFFSSKGFKRIDEARDEKQVVNANYLEVPLLFHYHPEFLGNLFLAAGGYLGVGINGGFRLKRPNISTSADLVFTNTVTEAQFTNPRVSAFIKKIDGGLNFSLGLQQNKMSYVLNYSMGFINTVPAVEVPGVVADDRTFHRVIRFYFGFTF